MKANIIERIAAIEHQAKIIAVAIRTAVSARRLVLDSIIGACVTLEGVTLDSNGEVPTANRAAVIKTAAQLKECLCIELNGEVEPASVGVYVADALRSVGIVQRQGCGEKKTKTSKEVKEVIGWIKSKFPQATPDELSAILLAASRKIKK